MGLRGENNGRKIVAERFWFVMRPRGNTTACGVDEDTTTRRRVGKMLEGENKKLPMTREKGQRDGNKMTISNISCIGIVRSVIALVRWRKKKKIHRLNSRSGYKQANRRVKTTFVLLSWLEDVNNTPWTSHAVRDVKNRWKSNEILLEIRNENGKLPDTIWSFSRFAWLFARKRFRRKNRFRRRRFGKRRRDEITKTKKKNKKPYNNGVLRYKYIYDTITVLCVRTHKNYRPRALNYCDATAARTWWFCVIFFFFYILRYEWKSGSKFSAVYAYAQNYRVFYYYNTNVVYVPRHDLMNTRFSVFVRFFIDIFRTSITINDGTPGGGDANSRW